MATSAAVLTTTDHAQWEIKLGDDAMMTNVRASFTGQELKITGEHNCGALQLRSWTLTGSSSTVKSVTAHQPVCQVECDYADSLVKSRAEHGCDVGPHA